MKNSTPADLKQILSFTQQDLAQRANQELLDSFYPENTYRLFAAQIKNNPSINYLREHFNPLGLNIYDLHSLRSYMLSFDYANSLERIKKSIILDAILNQDPYQIMTPKLYDLVDKEMIDEIYHINLTGWLFCLNQLPPNLQNIVRSDDEFDGQYLNAIFHTIQSTVRANNADKLTDVINLSQQEGITQIASFIDNHHLIHYAAQHGYAGCIVVLRDAGANLEAQGNNDCTALHYAAQHGHADCIVVLRDAGANVEVQNNYGNTALHVAAANGHADCIKALRDADVKMNAKNNYGSTALHIAALYNKLDCLKILIILNLDPDGRNNYDITPLHLAAKEGNTLCLQALITKSDNLNIKDNTDQTPLHFAAKSGNNDCIKALIDGGADVSSKDKAGLTPLQCFKDGEQNISNDIMCLLKPKSLLIKRFFDSAQDEEQERDAKRQKLEAQDNVNDNVGANEEIANLDNILQNNPYDMASLGNIA